MENPQITIYGFGYVGKAIHNFLKDHYKVQIFDPVVKDSLVINDRKKLKRTPLAVVCVPTPSTAKKECDTSIVEEMIRKSNHDSYLIKSTIVPGTTSRLVKETGKNIAFSPEYIGEGKYEIPFWQNMPHPTNMKLHQFHIFGGTLKATRPWVEIWQKVAGWIPSYSQTDSTTAELVKYMENSFLATKNAFCNEFYDISQAFRVDYNELKELWLLDGRIGKAHTLVFPDARGFGGKCLPKDVNAIVKHAEKAGYIPKLLKQVLATNKEVRKEK